MTVTVKIGKTFRVVLPPQFRDQFNLQEGEALSAELEGGRLILTPLRERQRSIQDKYSGRFPGLTEELLTERHAQAALD